RLGLGLRLPRARGRPGSGAVARGPGLARPHPRAARLGGAVPPHGALTPFLPVMEVATRRSWTTLPPRCMLSGEGGSDHDELLEEAPRAAAGPGRLGDPARARRHALSREFRGRCTPRPGCGTPPPPGRGAAPSSGSRTAFAGGRGREPRAASAVRAADRHGRPGRRAPPTPRPRRPDPFASPPPPRGGSAAPPSAEGP